MALPASTAARLASLYPPTLRQTLRRIQTSTGRLPDPSSSPPPSHPRPRSFSRGPPRPRASPFARHGKAVESPPPPRPPPPHPLLGAPSSDADGKRKEKEPEGEPGAGGEGGGGESDGRASQRAEAAAPGVESPASGVSPEPGRGGPAGGETRPMAARGAGEGRGGGGENTEGPEAGDTPAQEPGKGEAGAGATPAAGAGGEGAAASAASVASTAKADAKASGPMQAVLYMGPPRGGRQPLTPPPYVHHFDTYSLVLRLQAGGYSQEQAVTAMKGVRASLARYLDVARGSLVSKSDVENETYLFRAACSELSAEVKNNRRVADENTRQQRLHLQHELDILGQTLNQELLTLNDSVRGMFNDRRMTVREEQRATDGAIQQLAYKISIMMSSEVKSEIESLRWVLIRRSVIGIIFMAIMTLGTLRYATYVSHERQREAERRRKEREEKKRLYDGTQDQTPAPDAAVILSAS